MFLGIILTFIAIYIPWDFITRKQDSNIAIFKSEFDPFEKFDIPLNDRINAKIRYYLRPSKKVDLVESYKRSGKYMPMIRAIFEEYDLPQVLVFLPTSSLFKKK